MAIPMFEPSENGRLNFSIEYENALFAILPASCALFAMLFHGVSKRLWRQAARRNPKAKILTTDKMAFAILLILHSVSLGLYFSLSNASTRYMGSSAAAYTVRFSAALLICLAVFLFGPHLKVTTDLYLLGTCITDGFRIHTPWAAVNQPGEPKGILLAALQTAIIVLTAATLVVSELKANSSVHTARKKAGPAHVDEPNSGTLGVLFFGWLWPLLAHGSKHQLVASDMESSIIRSKAIYEMVDDWEKCVEDKEFLSNFVMHLLFGVILQVLSAGAALAQPFIIQAIVSYLQGERRSATGTWLVIAMVFDQLAMSILEAHGRLAFSQMSIRMRSAIVHKVALRSLARAPPDGGWSAAKGKVLVLVTQDSAAVSAAINIIGMIIPNFIIVAIGSWMLFRKIQLAFLGPLLAAAVCTLIPILLGKPLSRSERNLLEAAECRIATVKHLISELRSIRFGNMQHSIERQAANERRLEIMAATTFRRILSIVIVVAIFLSSVAILAAFGGYSLLPHRRLDYGVLFTSLSTMQIMLTPLLSIIQMLPSLIASVVSWKRLLAFFEQENEREQPQATAITPQKTVCSSNLPASEEDPDVSMNVRMNIIPPAVDGLPLQMKNVTSLWAADKTAVRNASLSVAAGQLAIVAGIAGSGKSNLLKTILGETQLASGTLHVATKVSFCDQSLWFLPEASIRENIIFGKAYVEALYHAVITCCCLDHDFSALEAGDETKLSVIGAPLSGGQRRRVSLARALYESGDLFVFDDIFNGLDATTRNTVAANLFGAHGFLPERRAAGVLCCTTPPSIMTSFANTEFYVMERGRLRAIEKSSFTDQTLEREAAEGSRTAQANNLQDESGPNGPAARQESVTGESDAAVDAGATTEESKKKSLEAHRMYFKALGSPFVIATVFIFLFIWVAIERASAFWLSQWASYATKPGINLDTGYYVGIYAAFAIAGVLAAFISVCFINDIEAVDLHLPQSLHNLISVIASALGSLVVIGIGSPFTLIGLPILLPLLFFLQKFYLSASFQLRSLRVAAQAPMLEMVSAFLEGRTTILALRQEQFTARVISDRIQRGLKIGYLFSAVQIWATLMLGLLNGCLAIALAALLIGLGGSKSVAWGGLALVNIIRLGQDNMLLMNWWTSFESDMASMDRIYGYIHLTPQERGQALHIRPPSDWPERGSIRLDNLSLAYRERHIVKHLSVNIPPKSKVAILGRTGSTGGCVLVDGLDLAAIEGESVQSRFVGHPQNFIPNAGGTVRQNLDLAGTLPVSRIEEVLTQLAPPNMAAEIMAKLDSQWNECNFSEGWQQTIGICRTLLRQSNIYVLDEPTSGMDEDGHNAAMETIFSVLSDSTIITTTHTLTGIENFDQIIVLEDGRLVEQGSPAELLALEGSMLNQLVSAD
ncbi:ABC transporter, transmembrane domain, type 1 [Cordyceps fumosorosea ARSEF 2679]|uniref:ABC transporter, transmembrane domain, type 1 n=1 Tax=Cordyceps fumosorosea (strain ARSEF 2679) TaxID=1081104 RepID=A0A167LEE8_CORFA|nr:ABC transporter, transmembrane domain, type 1 [Cordyceps fumosorosea ARSEF 2679]OAA52989.1 ABC transporter, transmembrane domain, type 1 [Cordyceps fumosorosea ARSEF 2679]